MRSLNDATMDLIKGFEKCALTAYLDQAGHVTAGWGHKCTPEDAIKVGDEVTQLWADERLFEDLQDAQRAVDDFAKDKIALNDNQYGALTSLVFNAGPGPLHGGVGRKLAAGDYPGAASQFLLWVHVHINGVETVSAGLVHRRKAEVALFLA